MIENYYAEEAEKAFSRCRALLEELCIPYTTHIEHGDKAEAVAAAAERQHCSLIVVSTAPEGSLKRMFQDLFTKRVMGLTQVPVEVV